MHSVTVTPAATPAVRDEPFSPIGISDHFSISGQLVSAVHRYMDRGPTLEEDYVPAVDESLLKEWLDLLAFDEETIKSVPRISFSFKNVSFSVRKNGQEKTILNPISGYFKPGTMVAIMGPSGCGKTTLLDILSGKKTTHYEGQVYLNDHPRDHYFPRITSYVAQEDIYNGNETVFESLDFVSKLKADYGLMTPNEWRDMRKRHVNLVIETLGLDGVRNQRVGNSMVRGISGGQKRRLTLGKGLITGPSVAFLDEPTSGLSSSDSELAMQAVLNLTRVFGTISIIVIHQPRPSVFKMFDHLILLSQGNCVYNGPTAGCEEYFASLGYPCPSGMNPADFFIDIISPNCPGNAYDVMVKAYGNEIQNINKQVDVHLDSPGDTIGHLVENCGLFSRTHSRYVRSFPVQIKVLTHRGFKLLWRDKEQLQTLMMNAILLGVFSGGIFFRVRKEKAIFYQLAFLFLCVVTAALSTMNNIPVICTQKVQMAYEKSEGLYNVLPYSISTTFVSNVASLVANFMFLVIAFSMASIELERWPYMFLSIILAFIAVDSFTVLIAVLSKSFSQANSIAGTVIGIFALFNGFSTNPKSMPAALGWMSYLSPFYYAFEGCAIEMFSNYNFDPERDLFSDSAQVFDMYGIKEGNKWKLDILVPAAQILFLRTAIHYGLTRVKLSR